MTKKHIIILGISLMISSITSPISYAKINDTDISNNIIYNETIEANTYDNNTTYNTTIGENNYSSEAKPILNVTKKKIVKNNSYQLKLYNVTENQTVTYKSSSKSIATVDNEGLITAIKTGSCTITVTIKEGFKTVSTLKCSVKVGPPAISIKFTKSELNLKVGKKTTLKPIIKPNNTAEEAIFTSNDSDIASISTNGVVTGISEGTTYVFAYINENLCTMCKVNIIAED